MNEQDIKINLENIEKQLTSINRKTPSHFGALGRGVMTGIGSVIGVALAITVIGFMLNILGVIPAFRNEVDSWKDILDNAQNYRSSFIQKK
ncbi:MAG: hypothetical protein IT410_03820 [Candidatus Doudnabacteria bacterium]|nr:hypothetical protein [Candidatus Doudnabacteria bacterium]